MKLDSIALIVALALPVAASAQPNPGASQNPNEPGTSQPGAKPPAASQPGTASKEGKEKLSEAGMEALAHFHHVNQEEIELGKLAEKQGGTQAVKAYGQMLVRDHEAANKQLAAFAKKHGVKIAADKPRDQQEQAEQQATAQAIDQLKSLKGNNFDTMFLQIAVRSHEQAIQSLDASVGQIQNQELKTLLQDLKPTLQKHEDQARNLQKTSAQAMK